MTHGHTVMVRKCMKSLKIIVQKFNLTDQNITTILYTICRVLQFTKSPFSLQVALAIAAKPTVDITVDSSPWLQALMSTIENIRNRIQNYTLVTHSEVELMFICLAGAQDMIQRATELLQFNNKNIQPQWSKLVR